MVRVRIAFAVTGMLCARADARLCLGQIEPLFLKVVGLGVRQSIAAVTT